MKISILGNNSALPAFGRSPTAQVVSIAGKDLLIDCGEGTQVRMQQYGIKWRNMDHIFISHLHGDHYFGIFGLLNSMSLLGRTTALHLYAPAPLEALIQSVLKIADANHAFPFHFHPLPEGSARLVDTKLFSVDCFPVEHRIQCHGFLVTTKTRTRKLLPAKLAAASVPKSFFKALIDGADYTDENGTVYANDQLTSAGPKQKRYAFCADTRFTHSFLEHIQGVDMMYHESTYLSDNESRAAERYHSTAAQAAQLAKVAGAGRLLLGHYSSRYRDVSEFAREALPIFPNVEATEEGHVYEI